MTRTYFGPITLQPVFYKIFAALYRNRVYQFLQANKYIDTNIQKGFWPACDGISEHMELLTHLMKDAKRHQRSITITLLEFRNAFGDVSHTLIRSSLRYHHIPDGVIETFNHIYNGSMVGIAVNGACTPAIAVGKGVLQEDPCSIFSSTSVLTR